MSVHPYIWLNRWTLLVELLLLIIHALKTKVRHIAQLTRLRLSQWLRYKRKCKATPYFSNEKKKLFDKLEYVIHFWALFLIIIFFISEKISPYIRAKTVFIDVDSVLELSPCECVSRCQRFGGTCCLLGTWMGDLSRASVSDWSFYALWDP
jgi:hypothetical protein